MPGIHPNPVESSGKSSSSTFAPRFLHVSWCTFFRKPSLMHLCPLSTDSTPDTTKNRTSSTWSLYLVVSTTSPLGFSLCLEKEINAVLVFSGVLGIHVWGCCRPLLTCHLLLHHYPAEIAPEHLLFQQFHRTAHLPSHCLIPMRTQRGVIPSHFPLLLDRSPLRLQDCGLLLICRTLHNDSSSYRVHTVVLLLDVSCGSYHNHTYHIYLWTC